MLKFIAYMAGVIPLLSCCLGIEGADHLDDLLRSGTWPLILMAIVGV